MNNRGFALPLAILVLVALGLIGAGAAWMSAGDTNISMLYASSNHASDAAGAGIEHAVARFDQRLRDYDPVTDGDLDEYLLAGGWPLEDDIDGYDYVVEMVRDSFDFDGDGDMEAVSCEDTGGSGSGSDGSNGSGGSSGGGGGTSGGGGSSSGGGSGSGSGGSSGTTPADTSQYWNDGSSTDKDGDGALGFAEGHFDVDVFTADNGTVASGREYHQHQFDDKYDTKSVDLYKDPNLLWDDLVGPTYPNNLRIQFVNTDSARGSFMIKENGHTTVIDLQNPTSMTVDPKKIQDIRVTFESLGSLRKTNPGQVQKDAVNRDWSWTVRFFDAVTGRLVYENSEYWHYNKKGSTTSESSSGGSTGSTGGTGGSSTSGGGKHCKDAAEHEKKALEYIEKAQDYEADAQKKFDQGKTKDGNELMKKAGEEYAKADEEYAKAEEDCAKAKAAGETCVCGNYSGGGEPDEEETPPDSTSTPPDGGSTPGDTGSTGGGTSQWCTVNGNGNGNPVFVLRSTSTRGAWRASQSLRITSLGEDRVLRLSWLAD